MNKRVLIADAVIEKDGLLFAIKRGDPPCKGMYALPGGTVEPGEKYHETVMRELWEETGLRVSATELDILGSVDVNGDGLHGTVTFVKAVILTGDIILLANEITDCKWITLKDFIEGHYRYGFSIESIEQIRDTVKKGMKTIT